MNAEQLLAHYERIAEAPDAIARLRRFVLDLAVRGKLVVQDPANEPVSELLARIAMEKAELHRSGKIKKPKLPVEVLCAEEPYELPSSWKWVRLGDILTKLTDGTHHSPPNGPSGEYLYITAKNIKSGGVLLDNVTYVTREIHNEIYARCNPEPGDLLYIKDGATTGVVTVNNLDQPFSMLSSVALLKLPSCLCNRLVAEFLRSPFFYEQMRGFMNGMAITRVTLKRMEPAFFPVPPLAEQHRIVAKVDELMALCDRLEDARKEREAARDRLTAASLARLNAPDPDPATFTTHARFALDSLTKLSSQHRQIAQWRATIIELATRGKLSLENANDTPPAKALEAINDARDALVHAKLLRREKPLTAVRKEEVPFQAPGSWLWTRLGEVALFTQYGTSLKAEQSTIGVPVLTMGNIQSGAVVPAKEKRISSQSSELPELYLKKFDLLYNRTNSPELVGKTGIYLGNDDCVTFASYLIRLRFVADHTDPHFINLAMNAPGFRSSQISPYIKQQTGQANVNGTAMKNMLIALPPIEEQRRIVAKVDELMALCGRLETCLATGDETRQRLLEAILHEALEPEEVRELELA
ncbi:restriction endonuclease subunit S [Novosphingobium sp.]|uniref:restriction endonuclease subunit S n=1 Tax=Novosphingobium sp. TaxID=1874826 RepID=UPI003D6CC9EC